MERETGIEPATSTLGRSHSTAELLPLGGSALYRSGTRNVEYVEGLLHDDLPSLIGLSLQDLVE